MPLVRVAQLQLSTSDVAFFSLEPSPLRSQKKCVANFWAHLNSSHFDKSWGHLNMLHLKSDSWIITQQRPSSTELCAHFATLTGHPTPMPRALLFARSLSAFPPGNLVNLASNKMFPKCFNKKKGQTIHSQKQEKHKNMYCANFEVLLNPKNLIDESKQWLAQPLWPWTPKLNVPSHYTGQTWPWKSPKFPLIVDQWYPKVDIELGEENEDTSMAWWPYQRKERGEFMQFSLARLDLVETEA